MRLVQASCMEVDARRQGRTILGWLIDASDSNLGFYFRRLGLSALPPGTFQ